MTSSGQILDLRVIKRNVYFWEAHDKSYPKIQFLLILDKYFNISANRPLFGIGSFQIWSYHVIQGKKLSFSYLKSYSPLNFRNSHKSLWFCCISNASYKEDSLRVDRICNPPPPPCNGVNKNFQPYRPTTFLVTETMLIVIYLTH